MVDKCQIINFFEEAKRTDGHIDGWTKQEMASTSRSKADIQIVEKREAPLLGSRVAESDGFTL